MDIGERFTVRVRETVYACYVEAVYQVGEREEVRTVLPFSQRDPLWAKDQLLNSKYTLASQGCAVTCAAMIVSQVDPKVTPGNLNKRLKEFHSTDNGLLVWESVADLYEGIVYDGPAKRWKDGDLIWRNSAANMVRVKEELAKGPCIIQVDYAPGGPMDSHFVVALSYDKELNDIRIIDALDGAEVWLKDRYGRASWTLGRIIYGMRLLRCRYARRTGEILESLSRPTGGSQLSYSTVGSQVESMSLPKEKTKVNKFWELFEKNIVISGALALGLVGATVYLAVTSQPIPEYLAGMTGIVMGYFFGAGKAKDAVRTFKA